MFISGFWAMVLGFFSMVLFDINLVSRYNDRMETLYSVGAGLMGLGIFQDIAGKECSTPPALRILFGLLALASLAALFYCTFLAGKRTKWGAQRENDREWWKRVPVTDGIYALCRHPAVWCWWVLLLSLVVAAGYPYFHAILFSVFGLLLSVYEDRMVFPKVTPGYDQYKTQTPFLFPNRGSARRCRDSWGGKKVRRRK